VKKKKKDFKKMITKKNYLQIKKYKKKIVIKNIKTIKKKKKKKKESKWWPLGPNGVAGATSHGLWSRPSHPMAFG
jgi:hypothetical protein